MPDNYTLLDVNTTDDVDVRLVGIVSELECEAILNDEDAPRKISTATSIDFGDFAPYHMRTSRFVLVVRNKSARFDNKEPIIFISPVITTAHYSSGGWTVFCTPRGTENSVIFRFKDKKSS